MNPELLADQIRAALLPTDLKPEFRKAWTPDNPMAGHCWVASEAALTILQAAEPGWSPFYAKDDEGVTHWWLENVDGRRLDVTADQYLSRGLTPPYARGRRGTFQMGRPRGSGATARTRRLLERLNDRSPQPLM